MSSANLKFPGMDVLNLFEICVLGISDFFLCDLSCIKALRTFYGIPRTLFPVSLPEISLTEKYEVYDNERLASCIQGAAAILLGIQATHAKNKILKDFFPTNMEHVIKAYLLFQH